jgi:hypothetical protein
MPTLTDVRDEAVHLAMKAIAIVDDAPDYVALAALVSAVKILGRRYQLSEQDIAGLLRDSCPVLREKGAPC